MSDLYLLVKKDHSKFKIGVSEDIQTRMGQVADPEDIDLNESYLVSNESRPYRLEKTLHYLLEDYKDPNNGGDGYSEWFSFDAFELAIRFIEEIKSVRQNQELEVNKGIERSQDKPNVGGWTPSSRNKNIVRFSVIGFRIFAFHVSQMRKRKLETTTDPHKLNVKDVSTAFGLKKGSLYTSMGRRVVENLRHSTIYCDAIESHLPVYEGVGYKKGEINLSFENIVIDWIDRHKSRFNSQYLENLSLFNSSFTVLMHDLFDRKDTQDNPVFYLPETKIRKFLHVEDQYKISANLRRQVIEPSLEEIDEHTNINVQYEVIREGRSPVGLQFALA